MKNILFSNFARLLITSMLFLIMSQVGINAQYHVTNTWVTNGTGYFELRADNCNARATITCIQPNNSLPVIGHNYYRNGTDYYPYDSYYQIGRGNAIADCCTPLLTVNNSGTCPSTISWYNNGGYTEYVVLQPGASWQVNTSEGDYWDASNGGGNYTVNGNCNQTWNITPTNCCTPTLTIANNGTCPSTISINNGQLIILSPGDNYQAGTSVGQNWTASNGGGQYTANDNCNQTWNINPTDCCDLNVNAPNNQTICNGESIEICATSTGAIGNVNYSWSNGLGSGRCKIVSPAFQITYTVTATDSNNCTDNDNVTIFVNNPNGGNLTFNTGGTTQTICINEGGQTVTVNVVGNTGANQAYVVTDTDLNILAIQNNPTFNLSAYNEETILIWSVSFEDIQGANIGQNAGNLSGCFELSNPITVNKIEVDGGSLTFADGSTTQNICINEPDQELNVTLTGTSGINSAWVITDQNLNILDLPAGPPFDLSGAGEGTCLIWNVSFEDIQGANIGQNAGNLSGCFDLSNPITVNKIEVDGGSLTFADGSTTQNICINEPDQELNITLTGTSGSNSAWVITDQNLNILDLPAGPPFDLSGAGEGTCLIWNVSFEDIQGANIGQNAGNLSGCFDLSNPIEVVRELCSTPVNIGNFVWIDENRDGIQNTNEAGVADVVVVLYSPGPDGIFHTDDDVQEDLEITDNNGFYLFEDVEPGTYFIEFLANTIPDDYVFTNQDATGNTLDSDANEFGKTDVFTVFENQEDDLTWDAGIYLPEPSVLAGLGDYTWIDSNSDGIQDPNEIPLEGVTVNLYLATDPNKTTPIKTTVSNANGYYEFIDLDPDLDYIVNFGTVEDYIMTQSNGNASEGGENNSDADPTTGSTDVIDLEPGEFDSTIDAGYIPFNPVPPIIELRLQGAMNPNATLMSDDLRANGNIPLTEPYSGNLSFNHNGGEITTTNVLTVLGQNAIIDWVLVDIRDKTNPANVLYSRAALLQRDGDVVDVDGTSNVSFDIASGEYFVCISHRNHLSIMTAEPVMFSSSDQLHLDFTSFATATNGQHAQVNQNGLLGMWAGDINNDGQIIFQGANNDPNNIFFDILSDPQNISNQINFISSGYSPADLDFNNQTIYQGQNNDTNIIFFNVLSHPENTSLSPNYIIRDGIPD